MPRIWKRKYLEDVYCMDGELITIHLYPFNDILLYSFCNNFCFLCFYYSYSIDRASDRKRQFKINQSGVVTVQRPLDRETTNRHDIRILATDDGKNEIFFR